MSSEMIVGTIVISFVKGFFQAAIFCGFLAIICFVGGSIYDRLKSKPTKELKP